MKSDFPPLPERYLPGDLIGEGATGTVWRGEDRLLGREVAIKVVHAGLARHARFRARFAREVALCAATAHPRVVPVLDQGRLADGRPWVSMAYASLGSLADRLRQGMPLRPALRVVDQLLEALGDLHARGLVHQDLKPENLLLHGDPEQPDAWLADLGVAGDLTELAQERRGVAGTPGWMAPEQLDRRVQELGPWTDLYAAGVLLGLLLTGEDPGSPHAQPEARVQARVRFWSDPPAHLPPALAAIIARLVHPDPRQRYDRACDVRRALLGALSDVLPDAIARDVAVRAWTGSSTTFPELYLPEVQEAVSALRGPAVDPAAVPRWNREPPGAPPALPPPESSDRGRSAGSLSQLMWRDPPLRCREDVRAELWSRAREVIRRGEPQVVMVVGEPGSGKSRVVDSVARALDEAGHMEVVRLQYSEPAALDDGYRGAALDLLAPWNDTRAQMQHRLSRWLARDRQTSPEAAAEEALALARWSGHIRSGEPPVNAALGLAWLYRYLDAHSWRGGGCMVLEDVHLCQEPGDGLDIAEAILERTVGLRPLLVVLTINTEALARDPALQAWAARLAHLGAVMLSVHRHGEEEMLELLQEGWRLEPALARRLAPDCAGRPGFAALLIRDLATRDLLSPTPAGDFRLSPEGEGEALPTQVGELLERRLAGAIRSAEEPEAAALAAAVVALCGAHPPLVVAREVHPEGLEMLLSTGIVRRRSARLSFEDPGLRMVALRMAQDRSDRTELHRRIADAWEKLAQLTGLDVDLEHGRHRWQAGQADRAVAPLLRAGRAALASGRPRVALSAAELAVRAADACGVTMARVEARQRLAEALLELDQPLVARDRVEQAWRIGGIDRLSRARLDVLGARAAIGLGELELAAELADRARGVFEATRDRQGLVEAAMAQGMRLRLEGRPAEAAECFAAVLSANRGHDLRAEVIGRAGLVECRALAGGLEEVREELPALMELARSSGDTRWMAQAHFAAGSVYLIGRRWEAAERSLLTARALASTLGADRLRLACERRLAELGRLRGDPVGAADALLRAARRAEQRGWSSVAALARVQRALLHITRRDSEEQATEEMEHAARLLAAHPRHWAWIYVSLFRAGTVAAQGDERAAHAWWSAALERGLARLLTPEPLVLLERLRDRLAEGPGAELRRLIQRQIERLSGLAAPAPGLPPGPGVGSRDAW